MHEMTNRSIGESTEGIAAEVVDGHGRLLATREFIVGDHILRLKGEMVETPSRFSVQLGPGRHIDVPAEVKVSQPLDRYRWRFLNHSCEPNSKFEGLDLVAIRKIRSSEEITFDYNTVEYDLSEPFECHCGSDRCCGVVRGYRWQKGQAEAEG